MRVMFEGRQRAPTKYERHPTDMSYEDEDKEVVVRTPEQWRLMKDLVKHEDPDHSSLLTMGYLAKESEPFSIGEEATDIIASVLVRIARDNYSWPDEDAERFRLDGRPLKKETVVRLLNEDLFGLGSRAGYPNDWERRDYVFDKYTGSLLGSASETFEVARDAEGLS